MATHWAIDLGTSNTIELVDGSSVHERAGRSLRALGAGTLVDSFGAALEGDLTQLSEAIEEHRSEVVEAFVAALEGPRPDRAAAALAKMQAVEALPALVGFRSWRRAADPTVTAIDAAIAELRALRSLPRPALDSDRRVDTLPRGAKRGTVEG